MTNTKKSVIYKPSGQAAEYCNLALNHYAGCTHGCLYCSSPLVRHQDRAFFHQEARPRVTIADVRLSAFGTKGSAQPILLSFLSDPYQPAEKKLKLTRDIIQILHGYEHPITILTKAGALARRDFDLYSEGDSFGVTLTFLDEKKSRQWEPGAALPDQRIENLMLAKDSGIPTWVSLEPVIDPLQTLAIIHGTAKWVDHYKVGKLNYRPEAARIDWKQFALDVVAALRLHSKGFYIKCSLGAFIGYPEGLKEGIQLP